ncbi:MAG: 30S ribosomal protein S15, partial [Gammaproteobacteria bacterium]|nr:30S ribosomal protein S15 [Gammaproteobacteria bacterium]
MALSAIEKADVVKDYQTAEGDTGSPEVQVALLTVNINKLQGHFEGQPAGWPPGMGRYRLGHHRQQAHRAGA